MSKRLYYTDPIKALYMMKEFGVGFIVGDQGYYDYKACLPHTLEHLSGRDKFYIAKGWESIFEAKEGDEGRIKTRLGASYARYNLRQWVGHGLNQEEEPAIIIRDNKQFFMPEEE